MTKTLLTILLVFPWTLLFMLVAPLARRSLSRRRNPPKKQLPVTPLARDWPAAFRCGKPKLASKSLPA